MRKIKSIDDYTKEELYSELQKERAVTECLQQEIRDIKDIIRMQNNGRTVNSLNVAGDHNAIFQND